MAVTCAIVADQVVSRAASQARRRELSRAVTAVTVIDSAARREPAMKRPLTLARSTFLPSSLACTLLVFFNLCSSFAHSVLEAHSVPRPHPISSHPLSLSHIPFPDNPSVSCLHPPSLAQLLTAYRSIRYSPTHNLSPARPPHHNPSPGMGAWLDAWRRGGRGHRGAGGDGSN